MVSGGVQLDSLRLEMSWLAFSKTANSRGVSAPAATTLCKQQATGGRQRGGQLFSGTRERERRDTSARTRSEADLEKKQDDLFGATL